MESSDRIEETDQTEGSKEAAKRVWMDGCFDLFHYGHANALRQAKMLGDYLVAGIHSDQTIMMNKAAPIYPEEERYKLIAAVKWVDEISEDAPFTPTTRTLDKHHCDFAVHGEDISINVDGTYSYQDLMDNNRFRTIRRTQGISTTDLVGRMLLATKEHHERDEACAPSNDQLHELSQGKTLTSPYTGASQFLPSTHQIAQFSDSREPKLNDRVIYVTGSFDLFHVGHLAFLEKAAEEGDYLLVGIHTDPAVNSYKGKNYPIMNLHERVLTVLSIKYVTEVLIGAPYTITEELMDYYRVDMVVHGSTDITMNKDGCDPFAVPREKGKFKVIDSGCEMRTEIIMDRIISNWYMYEERNKRKQHKELKFLEESAAAQKNV